jgi:uncharacterized protein YggL (DUF469 family)
MTAPCPSFGFIVTRAFHVHVTGDGRARFEEAWTEFLEQRGLRSSGRVGASADYIISSEAAQATDLDRQAVEAWLATRSELGVWRVGELIDLGEMV